MSGNAVARSRVVATSIGSGGAVVVCDGDDGATGSPANDNTQNDVNMMCNHKGAY